jgi:hypothetical protein
VDSRVPRRRQLKTSDRAAATGRVGRQVADLFEEEGHDVVAFATGALLPWPQAVLAGRSFEALLESALAAPLRNG